MQTRTAIESIRWMIRRDDEDVLAIDYTSYVNEWSERDLVACLRHRNNIGTVLCDADNHAIAFCIYSLQPDSIEILRMAVDPRHRRQGLATAMLDRLIEKIANQRRTRIMCEVDGHQLHAQLTLSANGFHGYPVEGDRVRFVRGR